MSALRKIDQELGSRKSLLVHPWLHRRLKERAAAEGCSLNEMVSALLFEAVRHPGEPKAFERALQLVVGQTPGDENK